LKFNYTDIYNLQSSLQLSLFLTSIHQYTSPIFPINTDFHWA